MIRAENFAPLGAAYAPQTTVSRTLLPIRMPLTPVAPSPPAATLPVQPREPSLAFSRQPAPVRAPVTTPESGDLYQPAKTYTQPNYGYATPIAPPNPDYAATRYQPQVDYYAGRTASPGPTATEPTLEYESGTVPQGSLEETVAKVAPWYSKPIPLIGLTVAGTAAIVGAILILRK